MNYVSGMSETQKQNDKAAPQAASFAHASPVVLAGCLLFIQGPKNAVLAAGVASV